MAQPRLSKAMQDKVLRAYRETVAEGHCPFRTGKTRTGQRSAAILAAERLAETEGGSASTWKSRILEELRRLSDQEMAELHGEPVGAPNSEGIIHPVMPSGEMPVDTLIDFMSQRFEKEREKAQARDWRRIQIRRPGPFAVAFLGDPHMDNHGCNWPLLRRDVALIKSTSGLYAANAGDSIDNWVGRLAKLKGANPATDSDAWRFAEWLVKQLADKWLMFVLGNHDLWSEGAALFRGVCGEVIEPDDWEAKVRLVAQNGAEFPVWLAHSFKGTSQWNP